MISATRTCTYLFVPKRTYVLSIYIPLFLLSCSPLDPYSTFAFVIGLGIICISHRDIVALFCTCTHCPGLLYTTRGLPDGMFHVLCMFSTERLFSHYRVFLFLCLNSTFAPPIVFLAGGTAAFLPPHGLRYKIRHLTQGENAIFIFWPWGGKFPPK